MTQPIRCVTVPVLATASLILVLGGCGDLLDPEVYGDLTPETFFSNEEDFKNAVVALYAPFSTHWGNTDQGVGEWYNNLYNHHTTTYWARSEIPTDEMFSPWDPVFNNFDWGPTTFNGDPTYTKIRYVARATDIIDKIETSSAPISDAVRARYEAEARTLRAWLMYAMYDFFGPVNVKLDPATLSDTEITPRPSREEYVSAMVEDLTSAIPDLPERVSGEDWGRIAKGTARMILLRVHMHEKNWAAAEAVARDIEGMGYSLMSEYSDVCNVQENEEIIYAVPANASSPNWYWQEITPS
ncbi:MAG: RagB/SusD family nutrient uptake outer membrane protein, partial [Longimicrobiales bacterium]